MESLTTIKMGSLLLAEGTNLPASVLLESTSCAPGWRLIQHVNLRGFKELIAQAGWHFLFIATLLETTAYGWNQETAISKAMRRITAQSKAAKYNCVEVMRVEANRFLGIPYVKVTAHSRQIQATGILAAGRARVSYASE